MSDEIPYDPFYKYGQNAGEININQSEGDLGGPLFVEFTTYLREKYKKGGARKHLEEIVDAIYASDKLTDISNVEKQKSIAEIMRFQGVGEIATHFFAYKDKLVSDARKTGSNTILGGVDINRFRKVDINNPKDSHHLQSIVQAVERAVRR